MQHITLHPVSENDLPAVHAMILSQDRSAMIRTMGFVPAMEDLQRQTTRDPDFDPALCIGAFHDREIIGWIMGVRRPWKEEQKEAGFIKYIYIRKEFRGRGIGRTLLETCEKELCTRGSQTLLFGGSSPRYLFPGVPEAAADLCRLLNRCGWIKQSERVSLFTELDAVSVTEQLLDGALQKNPTLNVSLATPDDEEMITRFIEKTFSSSWAQEVREAAVNSDNAFCSTLRMKDSSDIIGFAAVGGTNPHWFGPMGVRADLRRQRLGHLLVYHSFLAAKNRGMTHLLIPWINGKETFYSKFVKIPQWQKYYKFNKNL